MNKLEQFIEDNRGEMDDTTPSNKVWENVEAALTEKKEKKFILAPMLKWSAAAAVLLMSAERARSLGLKPKARIRSTAVAGVRPEIMGWGPVPASRKALMRAGLKVADVALWEINEAFAAQVIACNTDLKIDEERLNVNGGAVALGHPLGCSGARLVTTLVHEMARRDAAVGVATMCIGIGQGIATIIEQL